MQSQSSAALHLLAAAGLALSSIPVYAQRAAEARVGVVADGTDDRRAPERFNTARCA
jgi:hypothetical protein